MQEFLQKVLPRFYKAKLCLLRRLEYALQQNETINIFSDEFEKLTDEEVMIGNKVENLMKEFQSFTDFEFSNEKSISAIDWKPQAFGVVAVACAEKSTLDTTSVTPGSSTTPATTQGNTSNSPSSTSTNSVILVWDFIDPIHPQVLIEQNL